MQRIIFTRRFTTHSALLLIVLWAFTDQLLRLAAIDAFAAGLPNTWGTANVGDVGIAGDATVEPDQLVVRGAGADVWGTADSFFFAYQPFDQGEFSARVLSEQSTSEYAKAGIDFRQTLRPTSAHVILDVKPNGSIEFMFRDADSAPTTFVSGAAASFPISLKLTHAGPTVTGWMSTDNGQTWTVVGAATVGAAAGYVGLAVTSHDTTLLNTARFDTVRTLIGASAIPTWFTTDVGPTSVHGTVLATDGAWSVSGEGADIWGNSDSFFFVHQSLSGDAQITARVTSVPNTNPYAKAGLMIRQTLDPGSSDVILDVKPDGAIEFMSRPQPNADTAFIAAGAGGSLPTWLRLVRVGSRVTGYVSADRKSVV